MAAAVTLSLQKVEVTSRAVLEIMTRTTEYLQPNPGWYKPHMLVYQMATHVLTVGSLKLLELS